MITLLILVIIYHLLNLSQYYYVPLLLTHPPPLPSSNHPFGLCSGWLALICQSHSLLQLRLTHDGTETPEWGKVSVLSVLCALVQVTSVYPDHQVQRTVEEDAQAR